MANVSDGTERDSGEKAIATHDAFDPSKVHDMPANPDAHLSEEEQAKIDRALVWRLDWILIPWLCILYLLAFLDRTNIGNAKIDNLQKDLGNMSGGAYNACLSIFFVSYALFEPLTNILLKRLRPSIFIPIIMILWGITMTFMGFVKSFSGLMAARWFLGLAEAGLFPGVNYYLSCWYKRSEFGIRAAIFFSAAAVAGSFGGLLAAAIVKMDGIGGKAGWAWIFILEGLLTVILGAASFFFVHDFPDEARFLSDEDRIRVIRRLKADQQSSAEHESFEMRYLYAGLRDYKMWLGMIIYMGCDMPLYAFSLFLPTIIKEMGFTSTRAQLLTVPPYAAAAILTVVIGWVADRTRQRALCNIGVSMIGMVGFIMLIAGNTAAVRYAGTFLGALGIYPCIANTITWVANNIEGVYKRGVVLGFVIGWGNLNGIVSSNIFLTKDQPRFAPGHGTILGYMLICLLGGSAVLRTLLARENKLRREGKRNHWVEGKTMEERERLGDKQPNFIYTL